MTSAEENLLLAEAFLEAFNAHDWDRVADLLTEDVVWYAPDLPEPVRGRSATKERPRPYAEAFPDIRLEKEMAIAHGDWLALRTTVLGTHTCPMRGPGGRTIAPTNRRVRVPEAIFLRVRDGKVAEIHVYFDRLTLLASLGLAP